MLPIRWLAGVGLLGLLTAGQFIVHVPPTTPNVVTNGSTLSFDLADLTDLMGFKIQVDGATQVDMGMPGNPAIPGSQAPFSSGITFTVPVSSLSLSNGTHTLTFCSYNTAGVLSSSCPTLNVTKQ